MMNKFLLSFAAFALSAFFTASARCADLHVPGEFPSIQSAIDAAQDGDTVIVAPGLYSEPVGIEKALTLRGAGTVRLWPVLDNPIIAIGGTGALTEGVTVRGLTLMGAIVGVDSTGIAIVNSANIDIFNNVFNLGSGDTAVTVNDAVSTVDIVNNTFFENGVAVSRQSELAGIRGNIFAGNAITVAPGPDENAITFNCFAAMAEAVGANAAVGDPLFVDSGPLVRDFHLRAGSPCIDADDPAATDVLDASRADAGAYGGAFADPLPFPVTGLTASTAAGATPFSYDIELNWTPNLSYLIDRYFVHYAENPGAPYDGDNTLTPSPIDVGNVTDYTLSNITVVSATPDAPVLQVRSEAGVIIASWQAVEGATAYRIYYGITDLNENQQNVGNITATIIRPAGQNGMYRIVMTALYQPTYYIAITTRATLLAGEEPTLKESVFSLESSALLGEPLESSLSNEVSAFYSAPPPPPEFNGPGPCFIATAAYGHYSAPQVQLLRDFRDAFLLSHAPGRAFVEWYYRVSPGIAATIADNGLLKFIVRILLLPLIALAYCMLTFGPAWTGAILLPIVCGLVFFCVRTHQNSLARFAEYAQV